MRLIQLLKLGLGFLSLAFAAIGLLLPIWPTTPFVLLSIGCFSSTPKLRNRLLRISYLREYYESYTKGNGLRRKTVVSSLIFLWGMLLISVFLLDRLWATLLLLSVGTAVTVHILWIAKDRSNLKRMSER